MVSVALCTDTGITQSRMSITNNSWATLTAFHICCFHSSYLESIHLGQSNDQHTVHLQLCPVLMRVRKSPVCVTECFSGCCSLGENGFL